MNAIEIEKHTILASYKSRVAYPFIRAWQLATVNKLHCSLLLEQAMKDKAPADTVYAASNGDGWIRLRDLPYEMFCRMVKCAEASRWIERPLEYKHHITDFPI